MKYTIIKHGDWDLENFEKRINILLLEGWELRGDTKVYRDESSRTIYMQTLTQVIPN